MGTMNGYTLSRYFWDFAFENTGKIKPVHVAIYFFAIEHCNRLGWKKNFGLPTSMVLEAITVKSYSVYKKAFDELVEWNFFDVIQYSKNQYSSNIVALKDNCKANTKTPTKALDKALIKHGLKQSESTQQSTVSINKQQTSKQIKIIQNSKSFYDTEIKENSDEKYISNYKNFIEYLFGDNELKKTIEWILKLEQQLTYEQFQKLHIKSKEKGTELKQLLNSWLNKPTYSKGKKSIYLTLNNWLNRE